MGVVQNIIGIVRDINDRREAANIDDALKNYLNDPVASIGAVMEASPRTGIALERQRVEDSRAKTAATAAELEARGKRVRGALDYLRGQPEGTDYGALVERMAPLFTTLGLDEDDVGAVRGVATSGANLAALDDNAWEAMLKDRYSTTVGTPGSWVFRGGSEEPIKVPFAPRTVTTRGGDGSARTDIFDPTTGEFITGGGMGGDMSDGQFDMTVEALRPHFVAQESGGDYTARNAETGAMGAYQIMPETGRALAQRLGLGWRPDMMSKDDPASRRYQDALGAAAIQEAIDASNGNPEDVFSYYYGGSNRANWGPRTSQYTMEMMDRIGGVRGGGDVNQSRAPITMPGKAPEAPERYRTATAEELAGYPAGTAAQVNTATGELVNVKTPPAAVQTGARLTGRALENAKNKLTLLKQMEGQMQRVNAAMVDLEKKGWTGYFGGLVPGGLDAESDVFDKAVATLTALVRNLTRTPGEGSMSDYESRLAAAIPPSRRSTPEAREEAMATLRELIETTRAGYEEMVEPPAQPQGAAPEVPEIGEVRRGYRYKGGNPAAQDSWEKVQ